MSNGKQNKLHVCEQLCANITHRHHQQVAKARAKANQNTQTVVKMALIPSLLQCVGWMERTLKSGIVKYDNIVHVINFEVWELLF